MAQLERWIQYGCFADEIGFVESDSFKHIDGHICGFSNMNDALRSCAIWDISFVKFSSGYPSILQNTIDICDGVPIP